VERERNHKEGAAKRKVKELNKKKKSKKHRKHPYLPFYHHNFYRNSYSHRITHSHTHTRLPFSRKRHCVKWAQRPKAEMMLMQSTAKHHRALGRNFGRMCIQWSVRHTVTHTITHTHTYSSWKNMPNVHRSKHLFHKSHVIKVAGTYAGGVAAGTGKCIKHKWVKACKKVKMAQSKQVLKNVYELKAYALATHKALRSYMAGHTVSVLGKFILEFGKRPTRYAFSEILGLFCKLKAERSNQLGVNKYLLDHIYRAVNNVHRRSSSKDSLTGIQNNHLVAWYKGAAVLNHRAIGLTMQPRMFTKIGKAVPFSGFSRLVGKVKSQQALRP